MHVRGAGLIGAAAGYGMYLATFESGDLAESGGAIESHAPNRGESGVGNRQTIEKYRYRQSQRGKTTRRVPNRAANRG